MCRAVSPPDQRARLKSHQAQPKEATEKRTIEKEAAMKTTPIWIFYSGKRIYTFRGERDLGSLEPLPKTASYWRVFDGDYAAEW
jgi:hypothetical protein